MKISKKDGITVYRLENAAYLRGETFENNGILAQTEKRRFINSFVENYSFNENLLNELLNLYDFGALCEAMKNLLEERKQNAVLINLKVGIAEVSKHNKAVLEKNKNNENYAGLRILANEVKAYIESQLSYNKLAAIGENKKENKDKVEEYCKMFCRIK